MLRARLGVEQHRRHDEHDSETRGLRCSLRLTILGLGLREREREISLPRVWRLVVDKGERESRAHMKSEMPRDARESARLLELLGFVLVFLVAVMAMAMVVIERLTCWLWL